jgi:uncharacterized protein YaiI (UPF0178 family)
MKILVDADACPVKDIIISIAKEYNIEVLLFADTSHYITSEYATVIIVDKGIDAVDLVLANKVNEGDIVVSQDYGVATMALSKKATPLNQNGLIFTNENIDGLLYQRYISKKIRQSGGRTTNQKKRNTKNNEKFKLIFRKIIEDKIGCK